MLSESAFSNFGGFFGLEPERLMVELEGIGKHEIMVFYEEQLASLQDELEKTEGPIPDPSLFQVLRWKLGLRVRTLVDMVKRRNPPGEARRLGL